MERSVPVNNIKIIGIIPARMASTRFPGKPLRKIRNIPMIGHVYYRSKMCDLVDEVYIATCDKEIEKYAGSINAPCIMTKDTHERASDRTAEAMLTIERMTGERVDIIVMIQGDEPMVYPEIIEDSIHPLLEDDSISVVNLMYPLKNKAEQDNPNIVKVVTNKDSFALYFSREAIPSRAKASGEVIMNKQVPIIPFRRDFLIKFNNLTPTPLEECESVDMLRLLEHGYKVKMVASKKNTYGVDTPEDLEKVEILLKDDVLFPLYEEK